MEKHPYDKSERNYQIRRYGIPIVIIISLAVLADMVATSINPQVQDHPDNRTSVNLVFSYIKEAGDTLSGMLEAGHLPHGGGH